jgi:hypothetical protein
MELSPSIKELPYKAGMPVRGAQFYGRAQMMSTILNGPNRAIWIVSNRRIGKTSLLSRLEEVANEAGQVAFYIALDASDTLQDLADCFLEDLSDNDPRLARLGLTMADLQGKALIEILRAFNRAGRDRGCEVVLLFDEAEALIELARDDDQVLKNLQHVIRRGQVLRVVIAATKRLLELDKICESWDTDRFLDPLTIYYLGNLEHEESLNLLRQSQSISPQQVDDAVAAAIANATGGHPYLLQSLALTLWDDGVVRAPQSNDLMPAPDSQWSRMFQQDYNCLSSIERRIMHSFASTDCLDEAKIAELIGDGAQAEQVHSLLLTLSQLCFVRSEGSTYCIANQILRNWLRSGQVEEPAPIVSDARATDMASPEQQALTAQIDAHQQRMWALEERQALLGINTPPEVSNEIDDIKLKIEALKEQLGKLRRRAS